MRILLKQKPLANNGDVEATPAPNAPDVANTTTPPTKYDDQGAQTPDDSSEPPAAVEPAGFAITASTPVACPREPVSFQAAEVMAEGSWHWDFGDGSFSTNANPVHRFQHGGSYGVSALFTPSNGDPISSQIVLVQVKDAPAASISAQHTDNLLANPFTTLQSVSKDAVNWQWQVEGSQIPGGENVQHLFNRKGSYNVALTVTAENGCESTVSEQVHISTDYDLLAPNAFAPGGSGGNNTWFPIALSNNDYEFTVNVYNRNNRQLVYTATNQVIPWDGRLGNGGPMAQPGNVFVWMAQVNMGAQGEMMVFSGTITIAGTQ